MMSSFSEVGSASLPPRSKSKSKILRAFGKKKNQDSPADQEETFELREDTSYKKKKKSSWLKTKLKFRKSHAHRALDNLIDQE